VYLLEERGSNFLSFTSPQVYISPFSSQKSLAS
jgi:hypothetical protein